MFGKLEDKILDQISTRLKIETEIVDEDDRFVLITRSIFDGRVLYTHEQDLEPLVEAIRKRQ